MPSRTGQILLQPPWPDGEMILDAALRIGIAIVVGFLVQRLLFLLVGRIEAWAGSSSRGGEHARQRAHTLGQILRHLCTAAVVGTVIVHSLNALGWDVRPLLAGAGILGVALGFGAQSLVRDLIAGLFILVENQYAVGDQIELNGRPTTVETLSMRSTTLRDFNGHLHFVPNGEMRIVVNRSRGWHRVAVDVPIAAAQDVERALEACRKAAASVNEDPAWRDRLLEPIEVWGVEGMSGAEASVRLVVKGPPGPGVPEAARELRRRIIQAFTAARVLMASRREIAIHPVSGGEATAAPRAGGTA